MPIFNRPAARAQPPPRSVGFVPVAEATELAAWFERSWREPVILFNYDPVCGGNVHAYRILADLDRPIGLVNVRRHAALGAQIAERTGVRHESPQVLFVVEGRVIWHADHWAITAETVAGAMSRLPAASG